MKRLFLTAAAVLATAVFSFAQEIRDIQTTVNLFRNGNAQVIQKWDMTVVEGTEWYIPIDNPGKSYIDDFMVFENGKKFESDGRKWNSDRSREAKTGRSGIVEKGGGDIELCWGQGEYGDHVFTIAYIIRNLVQSYPECDGFHWHFLNDEWYTKPQHVSITIRNETEADPWFWESPDSCNVRFWGFGLQGNSWMTSSGEIVFESTEQLSYSSFFSALVQFDKGLFHPQVEGDGTFEELKQKAMEGSDYSDEVDEFMDKVIKWIGILIFIGIPILIVLYVIFLLLRKLYRRISGKRYDKKIFGQNKIDGWYRNVPFRGNPKALYSLLQEGDFLAKDKNSEFPHVVSAYFLKWIQEGRIRVERDPEKEQRVNLRFITSQKKEDANTFNDSLEEEIYQSAMEAAGENLLLEANEFKRWSYKHDSKVAGWPSEGVYSGREIWQAASKEERCHAVEFKNFLSDFTLVGERSAPEVGVWKQYMIMAAALGIADKVAKNFEKLFPKMMEEYARQSNMTDVMTTYYVLDNLNRSSTSMMSSALDHQRAREAARAAARRRSSGGGGSISFGGGGGGFGGGHGGGSR